MLVVTLVVTTLIQAKLDKLIENNSCECIRIHSNFVHKIVWGSEKSCWVYFRVCVSTFFYRFDVTTLQHNVQLNFLVLSKIVGILIGIQGNGSHLKKKLFYRREITVTWNLLKLFSFEFFNTFWVISYLFLGRSFGKIYSIFSSSYFSVYCTLLIKPIARFFFV